MKKISINETYLAMVPRPSKEEARVLLESLLMNGQREPIIVNEQGVILDGHTRYDLLSQRGIDVKYETKKFDTKEDEELYVIDCNLARRHLNAFQKIRLVHSVYLLKKQHMKRGGNTKDKPKTGGASAIIGKTIGVNRNTVQMGSWLIDNAPDNILEQLENGTIAINTAYRLFHNTQRVSRNKSYPAIKDMINYFKGTPIEVEIKRILKMYMEKET